MTYPVTQADVPSRARTAALAILAALALAIPASAPAWAKYSARVRSACTDDYLRFCPHYDEESPKLRSCMRAYGKHLSPRCVRALKDAGLVSRKEAARRR